MTKIYVAALAAASLATALPAGAGAAAERSQARSGATGITLGGPGFRSLKARRIRVGASRGATLRRGKLRLPVRGGLVNDAAGVLDHRGRITFRARVHGRTRRAVFTSLRTHLGRSRYVSAKLGPTRIRLFKVVPARGRPLKLDASTGVISLKRGSIALTRAAARAIARRLRTRRPSARRLGRVGIEALVRKGGTPTGTAPPADGSVLTRPASAVDLAGAAVEWHVRDTFIRYINSGEGTSVFEGATADPPTFDPPCGAAHSEPLVYTFRMPFASGWFDQASNTAAATFTGGVRFHYSAHGIDLRTRTPEIELNGARSRALFRTRNGTEAERRGELVDLSAVTSVAPATSNGGKTVTYTLVPGKVPQGAAGTVFAGFYQPGEPFGCITFSFTRP